MRERELDQIVNHIIKEGGVTFTADHKIVTKKTFYVSLAGHEVRYDLSKPFHSHTFNNEEEQELSDTIQLCIYDYKRKKGLTLSQLKNQRYKVELGAWIDEDGKLVMDITQLINDPVRAIQLAIIRNQEAIYDGSRQDSIHSLPKPQTAGTESQQYAYALEKAKEIARKKRYIV